MYAGSWDTVVPGGLNGIVQEKNKELIFSVG